MALKFKTRGESAPNRKPKVYFSCHPDDFEKYNYNRDVIVTIKEKLKENNEYVD